MRAVAVALGVFQLELGGEHVNPMTTDRPHAVTLVLVLLVGVCGISVAAPLIRFTVAPALAVAFWRMTFSTALTGGFWLATRGRDAAPRYGWREWGLTLLGGILLGVHFAAWIESLSHTSVAASVVLVNTQPVFGAILATFLLREPVTARQWAGIAIAVLGAVVISAGGLEAGERPSSLRGNLLALLGAAAVASYYVVGRSLRRRIPLWPYVTRVYGVAAALLLLLAAFAGTTLAPYAARDWAIFAALAVFPTLLGHTVFNWSLRWLPAPVVHVLLLGEPVGAALLAALLPSIAEVPGRETIAGGVVTLAGIALVVWRPAKGAPAKGAPAAGDKPGG